MAHDHAGHECVERATACCGERRDTGLQGGVAAAHPRRGKGVVYAFRGSAENESEHTFVLQGVVRGKHYRIRFHDHSAPDGTVSGRELLERGLTVKLGVPNSSELVFIAEEGP